MNYEYKYKKYRNKYLKLKKMRYQKGGDGIINVYTTGLGDDMLRNAWNESKEESKDDPERVSLYRKLRKHIPPEYRLHITHFDTFSEGGRDWEAIATEFVGTVEEDTQDVQNKHMTLEDMATLCRCKINDLSNPDREHPLHILFDFAHIFRYCKNGDDVCKTDGPNAIYGYLDGIKLEYYSTTPITLYNITHLHLGYDTAPDFCTNRMDIIRWNEGKIETITYHLMNIPADLGVAKTYDLLRVRNKDGPIDPPEEVKVNVPKVPYFDALVDDLKTIQFLVWTASLIQRNCNLVQIFKDTLKEFGTLRDSERKFLDESDNTNLSELYNFKKRI